MCIRDSYRPYYLYRQKNTLQNLENVGWCKPGHEGYYNIYIMEEVQTILSAGAGDVYKRQDLEGGSSAQMAESLRKLAKLPIPRETQVLPGHGEFSTFGDELDNNYYIRSALRGGEI